MLKKCVAIGLVAVALVGCSTDSDEDRWTSLMEGVGQPKPGSARGVGRSSSVRNSSMPSSVNGFVVPGSGEFTGSVPSAIMPETMANGKDGYTINLVDAPIAQAAKKVLGDIMGYNYVLDPNVNGTVTLQTSSPVSRDSLLDILEVSLAMNGAGIVKKGERFEIVPIEKAAASASLMSSARGPKEPGTRVEVMQLKYIAADEMKDIVEQIGRRGAVLRTDPQRNYIIVAGNGSELSAIRESVSVFDVDWMKGMSTALYPLKTSKPQDVIRELNAVFGASDGPNAKAVRFIPNARLNAILVITSRPSYLTKISGWIAKLDMVAQNNDEQLFVYEIQNRPASELATILQNVLAAGKSSAAGAADKAVAPDLTEVSLASPEGDEISSDVVAEVASVSPRSVPTVVADTENNALLISTTPREYERIEQILRKLDIMPTQVFLEAVIAEITLNDELKFGMRWYLENNGNGFGLSDLASGAVTAAFPGFSWTHVSGDVQTALNALSGVTKVKVISSPTLMVINNQEATLQVGDQVPTITQTSTSTTSANSAIVNSVELKDTGIILAVTPRINSSGRVMLDIKQEVSNVVATTTSGIDSPTIQQRKISTRVVVNDGESLALGGLIQEKKSLNEKKVPVLGDIPLFGNAFKSKTDGINRTELVIFIRPRVVQDIAQARDITDEFRQQFEAGFVDTPGARMKRDLKRVAN